MDTIALIYSLGAASHTGVLLTAIKKALALCAKAFKHILL